MNKKYWIILALWMPAMAYAQVRNSVYDAYINTWRETAVQQQQDYGVPASITMAQALLESAAGKSELAVNANNHFGIKCTGEWFGGVYYYDDDSKGECFRQYSDAAESFKDHSLFLKRPRYTTCFEIAIEDYEGWAHRLKACGYATDPLYAHKLIKIIEDYRLYDLDKEQAQSTKDDVPGKALKATVVTQAPVIAVISQDPEPEYVEPLSAKAEKDSFLLMHPVKRCNGMNYVTAREGDTYANVAFRLNVRERDLREHNDALGREMKAGDRIFLGAKRTYGVNEYVWSHPGQSLWELSQEEGVRLSSIQKYNGLEPSVRTFKNRQKIYLKKVKEEHVRY